MSSVAMSRKSRRHKDVQEMTCYMANHALFEMVMLDGQAKLVRVIYGICAPLAEV